MIAGDMPGHPPSPMGYGVTGSRKTTERQRVVLYTIAIILSVLMTAGLVWVWNSLEKDHNADAYHEKWDQF